MSPIADKSTLPVAAERHGLAQPHSQDGSRSFEQLAKESSRDSITRRKLISAVLWCALAVALNILVLETVARFFAFTVKPPLSSSIEGDQKFKIASNMYPDHKFVVLMGDSLMARAINPELLKSLLHSEGLKDLRVVNLAIDGGTQATAIKYLEYLREQRHVKPRLLVYNFEVSNTSRDSIDYRAEFEDSYLSRYLLQEPKGARNKFLGWLQNTFALARYAGQFKEYLGEFAETASNAPLLERKMQKELVAGSQTEFSYAGAKSAYQTLDESDLPAQQTIARKFMATGPNAANFQFHKEFYSLITAYCRGQNIPLVFVWLPNMGSMYDKYFYKAPYTKAWFLDKFMRYKSDFCTPLYMGALPENPSFYQDFRHLNVYGSTKATELFAQYLASNYKEQLLAK